MRYISDFIGEIKARQSQIANSLVEGHAVNYETYQRLVGQHQGLAEALVILDNLLKEDIDDVK
tara:strand:+ start:6853 stop:7041 length:189 start_codon:yes stop_codon:yes gene_type:complete